MQHGPSREMFKLWKVFLFCRIRFKFPFLHRLPPSCLNFAFVVQLTEMFCGLTNLSEAMNTSFLGSSSQSLLWMPKWPQDSVTSFSNLIAKRIYLSKPDFVISTRISIKTQLIKVFAIFRSKILYLYLQKREFFTF
jgi:hypothetical protein